MSVVKKRMISGVVPMRDLPLISIVGATGTGKSQLAVDIASKYNGEVINGDAMQLYAGLPIITNKITEDERKGVPHHLLGCIGHGEPTWTVGAFVKAAIEKIQEIRSRGRLPVLVGGTHYYTQALLFKDVLAEELPQKDYDQMEHVEDSAERWPILEASTSDILAELAKVDPIMAQRWHPNDRRKIRRSLEIYLQTGRPASEIYQGQRVQRRKSDASSASNEQSVSQPTLRMETLTLWVHANKEPLWSRLDSRVDKMMSSGLLDEVSTLAKTSSSVKDMTSGIHVAIGYKEFLPYVSLLRQDAENLSTGNDDGLEKQKQQTLLEATECTKAATRQYAKRQVRWIRIKLASALQSADSPLYLLDGTDLARYPDTVTTKGLDLVGTFLSGEQMPSPEMVAGDKATLLMPDKSDMSNDVGKWQRQYCEVCDMVGVTESDWKQHLASKRHRMTVRKRKREQERQPQDNDQHQSKSQ